MVYDLIRHPAFAKAILPKKQAVEANSQLLIRMRQRYETSK